MLLLGFPKAFRTHSSPPVHLFTVIGLEKPWGSHPSTPIEDTTHPHDLKDLRTTGFGFGLVRPPMAAHGLG